MVKPPVIRARHGTRSKRRVGPLDSANSFSSSSSSSPPTTPLLALHKVLSSIMARSDSSPFLHPVDHVSLNLPDYPLLIKTPMDLTTILTSLNSYGTHEALAADIRLCFTNAALYNLPHSDYHDLAHSSLSRFNSLYKSVLAAAGEPEGSADCSSDSFSAVGRSTAVVPLSEKASITGRIFALPPSDLGALLTHLSSSCPSSLSRVAGETEGEPAVEINFDAMGEREWRGVVEWVEGREGSGGGGGRSG